MSSPYTRIIVIGGSAGSLDPLRTILSGLPVDLGAAVFVVQHVSFRSRMPEILARSTALPVHRAVDQEPIAPGTVYVAGGDSHLCVGRGHVRLQVSPKDPWNRPSINVLFRSAAAAYGSSVAAVVLSGRMSDGVAGLWEVKRSGGITIVQDPADAASPSMPERAMHDVDVDHSVPAGRIGALLTELVGADAGRAWRSTGPRLMVVEDDASQAIDLESQLRALGYRVVANVATGEEALEAARHLPDLALVDIKLAGDLDGIETAAILRSRFKVGVVYTTSHDDDETIRRLGPTRPYGYIAKPIRRKDLHGAVEVALSASGYMAGPRSG